MYQKLDANTIKRNDIIALNNTEKFSSTIINEVATILQTYVATTLGPNGSTALIYKKEGYPKITKDGVTVARSIRLDDHIKNAILDIIVAVAITIVNTVGDGTTTAIIIATELYKQFYNLLTQKVWSDSENNDDKRIKIFEIIKTFEKLEGDLIKKVSETSKQIETKEELKQIALLASNGDKELADMITEAFDIVGVDGGILIKKDLSLRESYLNFLTGYQLNSGYYTHYFLKQHEQKLKIDMKKSKVLIYDGVLTNHDWIMPALSDCVSNKRGLLIVCHDIDKELLNNLIENRLNGALDVVVIKAPGVGNFRSDILEDLSIALNIKKLTQSISYSNSIDSYLAKVDKIEIASDQTVISGVENYDEDRISDYIKSLQFSLESTDLSGFEEAQVRERIARLSGQIATINIGGNSEIEISERKDRCEDAIYSVRAALSSGYVIGAGKMFFDLSKYIKENYEQNDATTIICKTFEKPVKVLLANNGYTEEDYENIYKEQYEAGFIYDVRLDDVVRYKKNTPIKSRVVDPALVITKVIESTFSIVKTLISTGVIISELGNNNRNSS